MYMTFTRTKKKTAGSCRKKFRETISYCCPVKNPVHGGKKVLRAYRVHAGPSDSDGPRGGVRGLVHRVLQHGTAQGAAWRPQSRGIQDEAGKNVTRKVQSVFRLCH